MVSAGSNNAGPHTFAYFHHNTYPVYTFWKVLLQWTKITKVKGIKGKTAYFGKGLFFAISGAKTIES